MRTLCLMALCALTGSAVSAQVLIPATAKSDFVQTALTNAGKRIDPFVKPTAAQPAPLIVAPPPPPLPKISPYIPMVPQTPVALSIRIKGFVVASGTQPLAILSREGYNDIAQVGDTILAAQVVAISPVARTVTFSENGKYVIRSLEVSP